MKNVVLTALGRSRNAITSLLLAAGILFVMGFACNTGSKPLPPEYVGVWTATDGTTLTLRADATGDYVSGGTHVTGGAVEIEGSTLTVKLLGMGPSFKIDKPPSGNSMTLDGMVYRRSGGGPDTASDSKSENKASKPEIPGEEKLQTLVKTTFMDFSDAVQDEDFTDFHNKIAKVWQDQSTPDELNDAFRVFIENKADYNFKRAVSPLDATFTPSPSIGQVQGMDALIVKGYYPTKPERANFELKYTMEGGSWKLVGINIKTGKE